MESYNSAKEAARRRKRERKKAADDSKGGKSRWKVDEGKTREFKFPLSSSSSREACPLCTPEIQAGGDFLVSGRAIFLGMTFWFLPCSAQNQSTAPTRQNQSNKKGLDPSQSKQARVDETPSAGKRRKWSATTVRAAKFNDHFAAMLHYAPRATERAILEKK